jgi:glyceraldehyde-3-phosphate dehydrogenase (ferredoxin)
MDAKQKVLFVDAGTGFYRVAKYAVGDFFGPVDLGLHLAGRFNSLNIGVGLLAGSILPGSNRLVVTGFSPCWGGFYISSMGGAGLIFDNLGINMLSLVGKAAVPSVLVLNRQHGEEVDVSIEPVDLARVWAGGRPGVYGLLDHVHGRYTKRFHETPRILAVGPAAQATDFGGIVSVPIDANGALTHVDTWAGRGGFGTRLLRDHNIAAIIYGGTVVDEDFRDRKVADEWFQVRFQKRLAAKDFEATTKYRFEPKLATGGTLGVNFTTLGGAMLSFNYRSIYWSEADRVALHKTLVVDHYLKQFNEETIAAKQQHTCGEPCAAVCKKMRDEFKKDYEPYETMGPQCGIFDQRAAETLTHHADAMGFDAISVGGVLSWLMECLHEKALTPGDLGVDATPVFDPENFRVVEDSAHNAALGVALLDAIVSRKIDLENGPRRRARRMARIKGRKVLDLFVHTAFARKGWMVPNQYWTPGALAPMPIMGKYYMYYGQDFLAPRQLGRLNADRMIQELLLDNLGICRFHRGWAEDMGEGIVEALYGMGKAFVEKVTMTAGRINSRNSSVFWEAGRNADLVYEFLKRARDVGNVQRPELGEWIGRFEKDRREAALDFWYEMHKGAHESLLEF